MRSKVLIFLGVISLVVILGWLSTRLLVSLWISPVLDAVFRESVTYYSDGLYKVEYSDMKVRPLDQEVLFEDFILSYDSSRVASTDSLQQRKWVKVSLGDFRLNLNNLWTMIPGRYLDVEALVISKPEVSIDAYQPSQDSLRMEKIKNFNAHQLISQYFDSLSIRNIEIQGASLRWNKFYEEEAQQFEVSDISADIEGLRIDSATVQRNLGYPYAKDFRLEVKELSYYSADSLYAFKLGSITADPVNKKLMLSDFSVTPQLGEYAFARSLGHQQDRIALEVADISLEGIDLHYLVVQQAIIASLFQVEQAVLEVFKDKRLKKITRSPKPMIQEMLLNIPIPFRLDTLRLSNSSIHYREHVREAASAGEISFDPLYMTAYNITNLDSLLARNLHMEADIRTRFMNKTWLDFNLEVPLHDTTGYHRIVGRLSEGSLLIANRMLEPTAFVSVKSGHNTDLSFVIEADAQQAGGEVSFIYEDLKIEMLNKEEPDDPKLKEKISSFFANTFVVKTHNPSGGKDPRLGTIYFVRETDKSIFSYWGQSLLSGIKPSIGLGNDAEKNDNEQEKEEKPGLLKRIFGGKKSDEGN